MDTFDKTITFSLSNDKETNIKNTITLVYDALSEKGYNPINQIVGYILSEDPTYITTHRDARNLIKKIDRDELLKTLIRFYLTN
ncbi:MAG: IreB family regulatory phosphoprotein [Clostridia bacterium]|nr:IreB family regulatory phosphoprotein [Clostridia bacterium]MBQ6143021.1 IreB family regulatory phosphoprotein [Clostridia bacterium]